MMRKKIKEKSLFWNVDTQKDFMDAKGNLPVPNAYRIKKNLETITKYAKDKNIQVVNTCDWHNTLSEEFSGSPDFKTTFPPHCVADTDGANFIKETVPDENDSIEVEWTKIFTEEEIEIVTPIRNIIIQKDKFDVFEGNPNTEMILNSIKPTRVYVYGVATEVCVNYAIMGLLKRQYEVVVLVDAIQGLGNIKDVAKYIDTWTKLGAKLHTVQQLI